MTRKSTPLRAVFFDYDGVLTTDRTGSHTTNLYIARETGLDRTTLSAAFGRFNDDLLLGRTTHASIWPRLCAELGVDLDFGILERAFQSTPRNEPMFDLAQQLRINFCVGIITDNKADRITLLRREQNLDALFYPIVVSADIGADKSTEIPFRYALAKLSIPPEAAVFIDNNPDNLIAAARIGMLTLYHDDKVNDVAGLKDRLEGMLPISSAFERTL